MTVIQTPDPRFVKTIKTLLADHGAIDKLRKIHQANGQYHVYATRPPAELAFLDSLPVSIHQTSEPDRPTAPPTFAELVEAQIAKHAPATDPPTVAQLVLWAPRRWSLYNPMVLFPAGTFDRPEWRLFLAALGPAEPDFWAAIVAYFPKTTHAAINNPIAHSDDRRRPLLLVPLYGDFGPEPTDQLLLAPSKADFDQAFWCSTTQNGIRQIWAPRYTMFSRGNIKEKKRILDSFPALGPPPKPKAKRNKDRKQVPAESEPGLKEKLGLAIDNLAHKLGAQTLTEKPAALSSSSSHLPAALHLPARQSVVDLYAGIGYFTLLYLANGATVFCWEINPWSVEGLVRGLKANKYSYRVIAAGEQVLAAELRRLAESTRCIVFLESNEHSVARLAGTDLPISHINLGLLPTLQPLWPHALQLAALGRGGPQLPPELRAMVHIHENVLDKDLQDLQWDVSSYFGDVVHTERVKTFAPGVWHVVLDVSVPPAHFPALPPPAETA